MRLVHRRRVANVALVGLNSDAVPLVLFGSALAGVPFAPINYRLGDEQLRGILSRLAPALAVVDPDVAERVGELDGIEVITTDELRPRSPSPPVTSSSRRPTRRTSPSCCSRAAPPATRRPPCCVTGT